jgi:hypothetical protein
MSRGKENEMKKEFLILALFSMVLALVFIMGGLSIKADAVSFENALSVSLRSKDDVKPLASGKLSVLEKEGLLYMREEEKLARDVYLTFYDIWKLNNFYNISNSEQHHMDAIKNLLDKYGLNDPAAGKGIGEFTNSHLQGLYNQLVEEGSSSAKAALIVGGKIEEIDILDLQKYKAGTNKSDIINVYDNLIHGSENHLRSFVGTLSSKYGVTYEPQYLSEEEFNSIINSSGGKGGGKGGGGCGCGN